MKKILIGMLIVVSIIFSAISEEGLANEYEILDKTGWTISASSFWVENYYTWESNYGGPDHLINGTYSRTSNEDFWAPDLYLDNIGQWIEIHFPEPIEISQLRLTQMQANAVMGGSGGTNQNGRYSKLLRSAILTFPGFYESVIFSNSTQATALLLQPVVTDVLKITIDSFYAQSNEQHWDGIKGASIFALELDFIGNPVGFPPPSYPTVSSTSPIDNAVDVEVGLSISATFSEDMDPTTMTPDTFFVSDGTNNIEGTVTYSDRTASFTPNTTLDYNTTFTATITADVQNTNQIPLGSDYSWSFTTAEASALADSDGDGIINAWDHQCPNTPSGAAVYSDGCEATDLFTQEDVDNKVAEAEAVKDAIITEMDQTIASMYTQEQLNQAVVNAEALKDAEIANLNAAIATHLVTIAQREQTISELIAQIDSMYTQEELELEIANACPGNSEYHGNSSNNEGKKKEK